MGWVTPVIFFTIPINKYLRQFILKYFTSRFYTRLSNPAPYAISKVTKDTCSPSKQYGRAFPSGGPGNVIFLGFPSFRFSERKNLLPFALKYRQGQFLNVEGKLQIKLV
jgi:hypothetical protein